MTTELTWTGSPDDQTAKVGNYVLRVEQMDKGLWWWCVYYKNEQIDSFTVELNSEAKTACEKAYYEHLTPRHDK